MKSRIISAAVGSTLLVVTMIVTMAFGEEQSPLKDQEDKLNYVLGLDVGTDLKKLPIKINAETFLLGVRDALSDGKKLLSDDEVRETMAVFRKELADKQVEAMKKLGEKNKTDGEAFLAENGKKEGVKTLPSGLQYRVISEGSGRSPKATDITVVHYRGTFTNGNEFDSSYRRGQPVTFPVNGTIPGWSEALQLMKEGAKWQLFIPPSLAYGDKGAPNLIGPNATLLFEVELIEVR